METIINEFKDQLNTPLEIGIYYQMMRRQYSKKRTIHVGKVKKITDKYVIFEDVVEKMILTDENGKPYYGEVKRISNQSYELGTKFNWLHKDTFDEDYYSKINNKKK